MSEDREQRIWNEIKRRAKDVIKYGTMPVRLNIQDGNIVFGEFQPGQETIKIA